MILLSELAEKQIRYELGRLSGNRMVDVGPGTDVQPEDLKDLLKVVVPDIKSVTTRLRESIKSYATQPGADGQLVLEAQEHCEMALDWITTVEVQVQACTSTYQRVPIYQEYRYRNVQRLDYNCVYFISGR